MGERFEGDHHKTSGGGKVNVTDGDQDVVYGDQIGGESYTATDGQVVNVVQGQRRG